MSDYLIFAQLPYLAVAGCVIAAVIRHATAVSVADAAASTSNRIYRRVIVACAGAVVLQHLLLLGAPDAVLQWNRESLRLLLFEGAGAAAGLVCAYAALHALTRHVFAHPSHRVPLHRTMTRTVVAIAVVSGVVVAVGYRWASSWSVVTLTPYLVSLAKLSPRIDLVASTPFAVRLHVVGGFAVLMLLPFTDTGSAALAALWLSMQAVAWSMADAVNAVRVRLHLAPGAVLREGAFWTDEER